MRNKGKVQYKKRIICFYNIAPFYTHYITILKITEAGTPIFSRGKEKSEGTL